jgi:hypothetical protein
MGLGHFPADPETENASPYQADGTLNYPGTHQMIGLLSREQYFYVCFAK